MVSIFWKTTTQKFHSINDIFGSFETEREAVAFAFQAVKAWVDSQPLVPALGREATTNYINNLQVKAARRQKIENGKTDKTN
jgi:hypothetical protein